MFRGDVDLLESTDGDLVLDGNDTMDTSDNTAQTYYQVVRFVLNTSKHECRLFPNMGTTFSQYKGMPNTRQIGLNIAKTLKNDIADSSTIYKPEIEVIPFPIGKNTMAFQITLSTVQGNPLIVAYDSNANTVSTLR